MGLKYGEKSEIQDLYFNRLALNDGGDGGSQSVPLLAAATPRVRRSTGDVVYKLYAARWWVLFWYFYIAALQSLLWMTFSSVPTASKAFLKVGNQTLQMFLNEGPIAYCCVVFFASWLLQRRNGLRHSVLLAASLCAFASIIRSVPAWLTAEQREQHHTLMLVCVHVGQIMNAAVAPLVVASPSYVSLVWFPETERNLATAVANVASAVGRAVGFFMGPGLVPHDDPKHLPFLLYLEIGAAVLPLLCVGLYYPNHPPIPPSSAAAAARSPAMVAKQQALGLGESIAEILREFKAACSHGMFLLLALAGGLEMGVYGAWSGVLTVVMTDHFGTSKAGILGSVNTFAGILGGVVTGHLSDGRHLNRRLKPLQVLFAAISTALFVLFAFALSPYRIHPMAEWSYAPLVIICALAGLFRGAMDPLFFELSAELTHPLPAGISGSVLTFFYHILLVGSLSIPSPILNKWTTTIMYGSMALCGLLLLPIRVDYVRRVET